MKKCSKCKTTKPESEFYETNRLRADGSRYRLPSCKSCYADYYTANRERQQYTSRRAAIKRRYGLTLDEYEALKANGCSVCGSTERKLFIDHCHHTNQVRACLCSNCNAALGLADDNPERLRALADYLEAHHTRLGVELV